MSLDDEVASFTLEEFPTRIETYGRFTILHYPEETKVFFDDQLTELVYDIEKIEDGGLVGADEDYEFVIIDSNGIVRYIIADIHLRWNSKYIVFFQNAHLTIGLLSDFVKYEDVNHPEFQKQIIAANLARTEDVTIDSFDDTGIMRIIDDDYIPTTQRKPFVNVYTHANKTFDIYTGTSLPFDFYTEDVSPTGEYCKLIEIGDTTQQFNGITQKTWSANGIYKISRIKEVYGGPILGRTENVNLRMDMILPGEYRRNTEIQSLLTQMEWILDEVALFRHENDQYLINILDLTTKEINHLFRPFTSADKDGYLFNIDDKLMYIPSPKLKWEAKKLRYPHTESSLRGLELERGMPTSVVRHIGHYI
jgi:hypothetical protein